MKPYLCESLINLRGLVLVISLLHADTISLIADKNLPARSRDNKTNTANMSLMRLFRLLIS